MLYSTTDIETNKCSSAELTQRAVTENKYINFMAVKHWFLPFQQSGVPNAGNWYNSNNFHCWHIKY